MIIRNITGDVTTPIKGIIGHGVNCQGVMGSGVALAIRKKFPKAYEEYIQLCSEKKPEELLGTVQMVKITDELYIANLFTQLNFGGDGGVYASLDAIKNAVYDMCWHRDNYVVAKHRDNFHDLTEAVIEVFTQNEMSPRQHYEPDAPFFANVNGAGKDSVAGDGRRSAIVRNIRNMIRQTQLWHPSDDVSQCIYDFEIFLPRIGAGLGGLEWDDVETTINYASEHSPVSIYTL